MAVRPHYRDLEWPWIESSIVGDSMGHNRVDFVVNGTLGDSYFDPAIFTAGRWHYWYGQFRFGPAWAC